MCKSSYTKSQRLLSRLDFQKVTKEGEAKVGHYVLFTFCPNGLGYSRLGISCSRKFGPAVARNRFKRLVREAFRGKNFSEGFDFNIRPRARAKEACFSEIENDFKMIEHASS